MGRGKGNGEGKERRGSTAGGFFFCVQNQLQFENDPLKVFFFPSVVGTSFGRAERGIQP